MTAKNLHEQKYIVELGIVYPVMSVTYAKMVGDSYAAHEKLNGCGKSHTFYIDGEQVKTINDVLLNTDDAKKEAEQQKKNMVAAKNHLDNVIRNRRNRRN